MTDPKSEEKEKFGNIQAWSRELHIAEEVLRDRLSGANSVAGRLADGNVDSFYSESDVRRLCADVLKNNKFLRFMSSHLVALVGEYETLRDGQVVTRDAFVLSGFILSLFSRWFWVTAGHCLKVFDKPIRKGQLRIVHSGFADYFGLDATYEHNIPFTYEPDCGFYVENESEGLDYGLIMLDDLQQKAFEKNGVKPVSRENWIKQKDLEFTHFKILGFPDHRIRRAVNEDGGVTGLFQPVMFAIDRIDAADIPLCSSDAWFAGQIPSDVTIPDIVGTSGGPIYGFRQAQNGQWYYHVVALQSRWYPDRRIILGCSLPLFAEECHKSLEEFAKSLIGGEPDTSSEEKRGQ